MKNKYEIYIILFFILIILLIQLFKVYKKESMTNDYMQGIDIIYWINLDRSKDRYNEITEILKDESFENIPNKRIVAFDGKNNPKSVYDNLECKRGIQKGENGLYGCLLSHLEAIRTFSESKYNVALICEDDMNLEYKKYWKKSVKQIINEAPKDWDIIMLSYTIVTEEHPYNNWDNVKNDYTSKLTSSTVAYLINKKGATKFINENYKDGVYHLDPAINTHSADGYIYLKTKTYAYKYPMFTYKEDSDSTISDGHNGINKSSKTIILEQYKKKYPDI